MYQQVKDPVTGAISASLIQRASDGAFIPVDERNADYRDCLVWLAKGNELAPVEALALPKPVREMTPAEKFTERTGLTVQELRKILEASS